MFHRIARVRSAVDCGCDGTQLPGWMERRDGAVDETVGTAGGGPPGGGAAQTAGGDRVGRDSAGGGEVAEGGVGVGGPGGRVEPGGGRAGADDRAPPGFVVVDLSGGYLAGVGMCLRGAYG